MLLLQCVVHAYSAYKVQSCQDNQLLLNKLLGDEIAEGNEYENASRNSGRVKASRTTSLRIPDSRANIYK